LAVQQRGGMRHIMRIGRCGGDGAHQSRIGIDADAGLVRLRRILRCAQECCATTGHKSRLFILLIRDQG